jgi:hypothetical protein
MDWYLSIALTECIVWGWSASTGETARGSAEGGTKWLIQDLGLGFSGPGIHPKNNAAGMIM